MPKFSELLGKDDAKPANNPVPETDEPKKTVFSIGGKSSNTEEVGRAKRENPANALFKKKDSSAETNSTSSTPDSSADISETKSVDDGVENEKPKTSFIFKPKPETETPSASTTGKKSDTGEEGKASSNPFGDSTNSSMSGTELDLVDLENELDVANLDMAKIPGQKQLDETEFIFADQEERLSEGAVEEFRDLLSYLEDNLESKEVVSDVVMKISDELRQNPELKDSLRPQDRGLMVRGLRQSYGVKIAKKKATATKKKQTNEKVSEIESLLSDALGGGAI